MKEYSEAFKQKLVQRMLMPNGPSANRLSQEVGKRIAHSWWSMLGDSPNSL